MTYFEGIKKFSNLFITDLVLDTTGFNNWIF